MNKIIKFCLLTGGGLGVLLAGGVAYVAATFNPNEYKPQIIQAVKDNKQRTLKLDGDIKLSFFPSIGADLGKVSLSEYNSDKVFAAIDGMHVSLALFPLLSKQVVVNHVEVNGLKATLIKLKNGKTNIDDLLGKDESKPESSSASTPLKFDIASVRIENTELDYRDENTGSQYSLKGINLNTGRIAKGVPVKVDLGALMQASLPKLDLSAQLKSSLTFDLDKHIFSGPLSLDVSIKQPEQTFNVTLSSPLSGNFEEQQFKLSDLALALNASGDKFPNKSISSKMQGSIEIDAKRQSVQVNLAGGLLQSQVKARVAVHNFDNPAIGFDVDVDQFDADLYLPKKQPGMEAKNQSKASPPAEVPFDLSGLKKLNLEGNLRVSMLKAANVKTSQLHIEVKAHNGTVNISPFSANLYQGSMSGTVTVNGAQAVPGFVVDEKLSGINIAPLLKDAGNFDMIEGNGNVALNLRTQGNTVGALKRALSGSMAINLADGAIKGINIAKTLRNAGNLIGKQSQTQAASQDEKTDFSEMKASFKVSNGVAHNDDLTLKSPLLRLSGNGDIDIGNDSINYLAKATLAGTLQGQGGKDNVAGITIPVRLSGPFSNLKYTLDFGAMLSDTIKQKVQTEVKTKLQDQLKSGLKGLFN